MALGDAGVRSVDFGEGFPVEAVEARADEAVGAVESPAVEAGEVSAVEARAVEAPAVEAPAVEAGEEAFLVSRADVAGEGICVPVCVLVDPGDGE